jgi:cob(I)alamin adenosyltransferase
MKGFVHVYTGNGKGKTTAAFGLALRAAGSGMNVFIGQFVKSVRYSEVSALERFPERITCRQYGSGCIRITLRRWEQGRQAFQFSAK